MCVYVSPPFYRSKFNVDVDGLPYFADCVHNRLKALEAAHKQQVRRLQHQLKEARRKVRTCLFLPLLYIKT